MLSILVAVISAGAATSPIVDAAVRGTDLCVQMQSGQLNLRGDDTAQSKNLVLASATGPGGVFLGLSPNGCDVLIGADGEAALAAVRQWMGEGSVARGWQQVPSLGSIGQGERGDRAQYFVSADYSMAMALAETLNDMARVVVLPQTPPELLRLRVETAARASARHAGAAVVDAVNEICPLISKPEGALTSEQRAVLMAQLRSYTGETAELVHTGEEQETVLARSDSGTCNVALRSRTGGQIMRWEAEVPNLLEGAAWKRRDDQAWENGEGVTLKLNSGSGLMSIEVEAGR